MHPRLGLWKKIAALLVAWATGLPASAASPDTQAVINALSRANAAVVGIQMTAIEGARSVETLGRQRRGSGVVIGTDGLILTIGYLTLEADTIEVTTQEQKTLPARAVAYDTATGFGLIRPLLPLRGVSPVSLGSLQGSQPGDMLMAATGGEDGDVSMTMLTSKRAFSGNWEYHIDQALFTSPPIGNHSGAALFNDRGELLGIGSLLVLDAAGGNRRLPGNMFVPVDLLKPILTELQETGSSKAGRRPWLGLISTEQWGRVQVVRVVPDSPAQAAGLQPGDLVLAVDGTRVATLETFYKKLWERTEPDSEVRLTVLQGAEVKALVLKAVDRLTTFRKPGGM